MLQFTKYVMLQSKVTFENQLQFTKYVMLQFTNLLTQHNNPKL